MASLQPPDKSRMLSRWLSKNSLGRLLVSPKETDPDDFGYKLNRFSIDAFTSDTLIRRIAMKMVKEEGLKTIRDEAIEAASVMQTVNMDGDIPGGMVNRRTIMNPFSGVGSKQKEKGALMESSKFGIKDPAEAMNPLRGKMIFNFISNGSLIFLFLQTLVVNKVMLGRFLETRAVNPLYGPATDTLDTMGGMNTTLVRRGQAYRLFWAQWLHAGWIHLLLNLVGQFQYLYIMEPDWGFWRVALVFFVAGLCGNLFSAVADGCNITVGSSGGYHGLLGGMAIYCIEYWDTIPRPLILFIFQIVITVVSFFIGASSDNTDNYAHLGGLIGGLLVSLVTTPRLTAFEMTYVSCIRGKKFQRAKKSAPSCRVLVFIIRILALLPLVVGILICLYVLFIGYEYQPWGHIGLHGRTPCCCCYTLGRPQTLPNWKCDHCNEPVGFGTWEEFCINNDLVKNNLADNLKNLI